MLDRERDRDVPVLIEPVAVQDVFVSGLAAVEEAGDVVRVTFYAEHGVPVPELVVAARIIMPKSAWRAAVRQAINRQVPCSPTCSHAAEGPFGSH